MRLTNKDRKRVRNNLEEYVKAPLYPISDKSIERTRRWAHGETMTSIARDEHVGVGRVSTSIRTLALRVFEIDPLDGDFPYPHLDPKELNQ